MNRFFLLVLLFGAVCSFPLGAVPEEEAAYCKELQYHSTYESQTDDVFRPFELLGRFSSKKGEDF